MSDKNETPPLYARFHGVLWMYCPNCGTQLRQQTNARGPGTTQCTRADCKRVWAFGIAVRPVMAGAHEVTQGSHLPTGTVGARALASRSEPEHTGPPGPVVSFRNGFLPVGC